MSACDHVRAGNVRMPIIRAIFQAELAARPILMRGPALVIVAGQYQRRRVRKMVWIAKRNSEYSTRCRDIGVPNQAYIAVDPPSNGGEPVHTGSQSLQRFPFTLTS